MSQPYSANYYKEQKDGSYRSAQIIVPLVLEYIKPQSVVDFGCGVGNWLSVFHDQGVSEIRGLDGDYVDRTQLRIQRDCFIATDLTVPLSPLRQYDLAMSVEVAEHIPADKADQFVQALTDSAPVVLFSAAAPYQGGTSHVNEQWPEYWVEKFAARGYEVIDPLRRRIWDNSEIDWWYAQNIMFFVKTDVIHSYPALLIARATTFISQLSLVHPRSLSIRSLWHAGPKLLRGAIMRKMGKHD